MDGLMTEERFQQLVAEQLKATETYADADDDRVDGDLSDVIGAVFEVLNRYGPPAFTD